MTNSNPSCLILKFLQEIKDKIYKYVCGNQTIHLYEGGPWELEASLCQAEDAEVEYQSFINTPAAEECIEPNLNRYGACLILPSDYTGAHSAPFNTELLRTCRKIYHDTKSMRDRTNTYLFNDPETLERFVRYVPHAKDFRSLRLKFQGPRDSPSYVNDSPEGLCLAAERMRGLKKVHIYLTYASSPLVKQGLVAVALMQLAALQLNVATVVLSPSPPPSPRRRPRPRTIQSAEKTWTIVEMREVRRYQLNSFLHARSGLFAASIALDVLQIYFPLVLTLRGRR